MIVLPHLKNRLGPLREACKEWRSAVDYALLSLRVRIHSPTAESERAGRMAARMPSLHALAVTPWQRYDIDDCHNQLVEGFASGWKQERSARRATGLPVANPRHIRLFGFPRLDVTTVRTLRDAQGGSLCTFLAVKAAHPKH